MASSVTSETFDTEEDKTTDEDKTTEDILEETARDFAGYVLVDPQREKQQLDDKIEAMLTRLDEFCAVVDMIRTDSSLSLNRSLPGIHEKAQEIKQIFTKIDQLEEFVSVVRTNVTAMEEQVNEVEKEQGTLHSIKNLLSSLPVFTQKRGASPKQPLKYEALEIFKTSDYLKKDEESIQPPDVLEDNT
ncbi:biogenesis of lysosome-related organelles complex 1 subunit 4-like [Asterias rubens]|uniref:biogenesis of lysosome-related organelles complex 1 subunit 4-like n=1 Tax=Asterias rubens TaxID=7604 RepID=UPI00145554E2|nr:biogenesis of lysosome-related organelles complex 1 subunit 4-like [Asterias rubens]